MCELDLAPEAPWRCPDDCPAYEPRLADVNWVHGSLVTPPSTEEPEGFDADSLAVLDRAEDIVNAVTAETIDEVEHERTVAEAAPRLPGRWRRWFRRG